MKTVRTYVRFQACACFNVTADDGTPDDVIAEKAKAWLEARIGNEKLPLKLSVAGVEIHMYGRDDNKDGPDVRIYEDADAYTPSLRLETNTVPPPLVPPPNADINSRTPYASSSYGNAWFDPETGVVIRHTLSPDFGSPPAIIDVAEWKTAYPGEDVCACWISDFGYTSEDGRYVSPCAGWRQQLNLLRRRSGL